MMGVMDKKFKTLALIKELSLDDEEAKREISMFRGESVLEIMD
jgi:hypothetical protein